MELLPAAAAFGIVIGLLLLFAEIFLATLIVFAALLLYPLIVVFARWAGLLCDQMFDAFKRYFKWVCSMGPPDRK